MRRFKLLWFRQNVVFWTIEEIEKKQAFTCSYGFGAVFELVDSFLSVYNLRGDEAKRLYSYYVGRDNELLFLILKYIWFVQ